jgi:integrase
MPRRRPNGELRPREHLTEREVERVIEAAKRNRHGQRDGTMILICFRHGLRASELCGLQWSDVEFETATLHLRRAKRGEALAWLTERRDIHERKEDRLETGMGDLGLCDCGSARRYSYCGA